MESVMSSCHHFQNLSDMLGYQAHNSAPSPAYCLVLHLQEWTFWAMIQLCILLQATHGYPLGLRIESKLLSIAYKACMFLDSLPRPSVSFSYCLWSLPNSLLLQGLLHSAAAFVWLWLLVLKPGRCLSTCKKSVNCQSRDKASQHPLTIPYHNIYFCRYGYLLRSFYFHSPINSLRTATW